MIIGLTGIYIVICSIRSANYEDKPIRKNNFCHPVFPGTGAGTIEGN